MQHTAGTRGSLAASAGEAFLPSVTICVLTYGDYPKLAKKCIESIRLNCERVSYHLVVGANTVSPKTRKYLNQLFEQNAIDRLFLSAENMNKCRMMRTMFAAVETEFIWWFDDDSYIVAPSTLHQWLSIARQSPDHTMLWGHEFYFHDEEDFSDGVDMVGFVKKAPWYRGKTPPAWDPGGKDESDFEGRGTGDGRWFFITGGCWMIRTAAIRALDWPDRRLIKQGDDVLLAEALRQQGWTMQDIGSLGVAINTKPRRGERENQCAIDPQLPPRAEPDIALTASPTLSRGNPEGTR